MSNSINKRKRTKILNLVKGTAIVLFVIFAIGYAWNSDFQTLQDECQSGLKVCR